MCGLVVEEVSPAELARMASSFSYRVPHKYVQCLLRDGVLLGRKAGVKQGAPYWRVPRWYAERVAPLIAVRHRMAYSLRAHLTTNQGSEMNKPLTGMTVAELRDIFKLQQALQTQWFSEDALRAFDELARRNRVLREAFTEYGFHKPACAWWIGSVKVCDCGFDEALKEAK